MAPAPQHHVGVANGGTRAEQGGGPPGGARGVRRQPANMGCGAWLIPIRSSAADEGAQAGDGKPGALKRAGDQKCMAAPAPPPITAHCAQCAACAHEHATQFHFGGEAPVGSPDSRHADLKLTALLKRAHSTAGGQQYARPRSAARRHATAVQTARCWPGAPAGCQISRRRGFTDKHCQL